MSEIKGKRFRQMKGTSVGGRGDLKEEHRLKRRGQREEGQVVSHDWITLSH